MTSSQFTFYLNGFIESLRGQQPTPAQWETIKQTLKESLGNEEPVVVGPRFQLEKEPLESNSNSYETGVVRHFNEPYRVSGLGPCNWIAVSGSIVDSRYSTPAFPAIRTCPEPAVLNSPLDKMWLPMPLRQVRDLLNQIL